MWSVLLATEGNGPVEPKTIPFGLQIAESVGQAVGTVAVIIALVAFIWQVREYRKDRDARDTQAIEDRERHDAQIAALRQAEDERLAAQARWVVPSIFRGIGFNPRLWNLRIDNHSASGISNLKVEVIINDASGNEVPHGYRLANMQSIGESMADFFMPEFSKAIDSLQERFGQLVQYIKDQSLTLAENPEQIAAITAQFNSTMPQLTVTPELEAQLRSQVNQAIHLNFSTDWEPFLYANRFTAMAIETTRPDYTPHLRIRYQDATGYTWERTDTTTPRRLTEAELQKLND